MFHFYKTHKFKLLKIKMTIVALIAITILQSGVAMASSPAVATCNVSAFGAIIDRFPGVMPEGYREALLDKFASGSDAAQELVLAHLCPRSVAQGSIEENTNIRFSAATGIYICWTRCMNRSEGAGFAFFHEVGHLIDFRLGEIAGNGRFAPVSVEDVEFARLLRKDFNAFLTTFATDLFRYRPDVPVYATTILDSSSWERWRREYSTLYVRLSSTLRSNSRLYNPVSDIASYLSRVRLACGELRVVRGNLWREWNIPGGLNSVELETFAHMLEAQFNADRRAVLAETFPLSLAHFEMKLNLDVDPEITQPTAAAMVERVMNSVLRLSAIHI